MRLRQPLNGFKLVKGNATFHLAFFVGSLLAVDTGDLTGKDYGSSPEKLVSFVRWVHLTMFILQVVETLQQAYGYEILS